MSQWGGIHAKFTPSHGATRGLADRLRTELEERRALAPTGSENGPEVHEVNESVSVYGRLRDVNDSEDSAMVLAWFVHHARWCSWADLTWELDSGPRYRFEWRNGTLTRLKGVLDA